MFLAAMNVITKMEKFNVGLIHVNIFVIALLHWGGCRLSITCAHVFQANETDTICFNLHFTSGQQLIYYSFETSIMHIKLAFVTVLATSVAAKEDAPEKKNLRKLGWGYHGGGGTDTTVTPPPTRRPSTRRPTPRPTKKPIYYSPTLVSSVR